MNIEPRGLTEFNIAPDWEAIGEVGTTNSSTDPSMADGDEYPLAPRDRLLSTIIVNGCYVHLEAVRVLERATDGVRYAANPAYDEQIDHAAAINGDGDFETATITVDGETGEYVIMATSYS